MTVLGHDTFGAAGGDLGSHVSRYLALDHPDRVVAVHRMDAGLPAAPGQRSGLTPEEVAWLDEVVAWGQSEGAYAAVHRTKPQSVAVGLTDSPAGLAAWIVEKLRAWSDCGGDVERRFTKDEILTNVTLYWLTGTIASSMRMYRANAAIAPEQLGRRVEVPSGFSVFAGDVVRPPRAWLERTANVVRRVRGAGTLRRGAPGLLPAVPGAVRLTPGQCQSLICTSRGAGAPVPVSTSDLRLIR
jgi:pimeloyl-ACP methyl ester carboxylesterase